MGEPVSIVWFRQDLRLDDNPALEAAALRGCVLPVYIWAPQEEGDWPPGAASRWWLHHSLISLDAELRRAGAQMVVRMGATLTALRRLVDESGASAVFWNRRYEPAALDRDAAVKKSLRADGLIAESFNATLLFEPWTIASKEGKPFRIFTPFSKACLAAEAPATPTGNPRRLSAPRKWPASLPLDRLGLLPKSDWAAGLRAAWRPGTTGASAELDRFLDQALNGYADNRDRPDLNGTSRLSPHLHWGEISPRRVLHVVRSIAERGGRVARDPAGAVRGWEVYTRELLWREFAYHLLFHFPHTTERPMRPEFERFPWADDASALHAWQTGQTGYPLVDAGMRQLWVIGWMHNRVRMIAASFLVKHLLQPWRAGARWFWDTLVDADLANNSLGWQWTAGCGADAAPYFRIFNPFSQGAKFDPAGDYVRHWAPELAGLDTAFIHKPWEAPAGLLNAAEVRLGSTYPRPVVEHSAARERALAAFAAIRRGQ